MREPCAFRFARAGDALRIAELHADSWRRHYRGAFSDAFLDGDVLADRQTFWTAQLRADHPRRCTILAEDGELLGFANTYLDEDPTWGALLDNLHVKATHKRRGIGSRLLALTAEVTIARRPSSGLYLWVLEQNTAAQAFYNARGGKCAGVGPVLAPGRISSRVDGSPKALRYAWSSPTAVLHRSRHNDAPPSPFSPPAEVWATVRLRPSSPDGWCRTLAATRLLVASPARRRMQVATGRAPPVSQFAKRRSLLPLRER